jgi:hypothetical protein
MEITNMSEEWFTVKNPTAEDEFYLPDDLNKIIGDEGNIEEINGIPNLVSLIIHSGLADVEKEESKASGRIKSKLLYYKIIRTPNSSYLIQGKIRISGVKTEFFRVVEFSITSEAYPFIHLHQFVNAIQLFFSGCYSTPFELRKNSMFLFQTNETKSQIENGLRKFYRLKGFIQKLRKSL